MGESATPNSGDVSEVLRERRTPKPTLEEAAALGELTSRLFGRRAQRPALSRYRILQPLGMGGLGVVFSAHDPVLERRVAVKLLRRRGVRKGALERLTREARLLARLSHPALVQVFDIGWYDAGDLGAMADDVPDHGLFIVMELVPGRDMDLWVQSSPTRQEILRVFTTAGRGLAAAHAAGVVHRDFKPSNVIVGDDGQPKILDFGLAYDDGSSLDSENATTEQVPVHETATGVVLGTPLYMSPEQHEGAPADPRSDQYSFCASLLEALLRRRPFSGRTLAALDASKRSFRVPKDKRIPRRLRRALARGLAVDANDRYPSMDELLVDLAPPRSTRKGLVIAGVGVAAWVAASGSFAGRPPGLDCEAEAEAIVARLSPSEPATGTSRLAVAIQQQRAREAAALREQLVTVCEGKPREGGRHVSLGCLAARDAERAALLQTLEARGEDHGHDMAAALRSVAKTESCLRTEPEAAHEAEIMEHLGRGRAYDLLRDIPTARQEYETAIELAQRHGLPRLEARARLGLGISLEYEAPGENAQPFEDAYFVADRVGDTDIAMRAAVRMIWMTVRSKGPEAADRWLRHAQAQLQRALAEGLPTEELHGQLAWGQLALGEPERSIEHAEEALRQRAEVTTHDDMTTAFYLGIIVHAAGRMGDLSRAEATSRRELAALLAALGDDHPDVADARGNLTAVLVEAGKLDEALEQSAATLDVLERWTPDHPMTGLAMARHGKILAGLGRPREGIAQLQAAMEKWPRTPQSDPYFAEADWELAHMYEMLGELQHAHDHARAAERRAEAMGRPADPLPAQARAFADACAAKLATATPPPANDDASGL